MFGIIHSKVKSFWTLIATKVTRSKNNWTKWLDEKYQKFSNPSYTEPFMKDDLNVDIRDEKNVHSFWVRLITFQIFYTLFLIQLIGSNLSWYSNEMIPYVGNLYPGIQLPQPLSIMDVCGFILSQSNLIVSFQAIRRDPNLSFLIKHLKPICDSGFQNHAN